MNKKWTPHIIAVGAFVVFIVLGLACASEPEKIDGDTYIMYWKDYWVERGYRDSDDAKSCFDSAIREYERIIRDNPKSAEAKVAKKRLADP